MSEGGLLALPVRSSNNGAECLYFSKELSPLIMLLFPDLSF